MWTVLGLTIIFAFLFGVVQAEIDPETLRTLVKEVQILARQRNVVDVCNPSHTINSDIYCKGPILEAVNLHSIFEDSKTFVDMPMKSDPKVVKQAFKDRFGNKPVEHLKPNELREFLSDNFYPPGSELEECDLDDWIEKPPELLKISDPKLREWALELNAIWKSLCRRLKPGSDPSRHSLITMPHEFIVPGGRFREFYYWDTYWITKGLIACEMINTTKKMIANFVSIVDRYGFVPNGGRVYYLQRSQPPYLLGMVYEYFEKTNDIDYIRKILPSLEKEFAFWQNNRTVGVTAPNRQNYTVYRYKTNSNVPRPESFREDIMSARDVQFEDKAKFWQDVASAAEAGWDFSTRWLRDDYTFAQMETSDIAPVDLNAVMCWNMKILEYLLRRAGNVKRANKYRLLRDEFLISMQDVFYNDTIGAWFDYNIARRVHNTEFYPSVATPLFAGCYQSLNMAKSQRIFEYFSRIGAFNFVAGVPTSTLVKSGQQWDFPNGFANLNHIIIEGFRKSENPYMQDEAFNIAQKWVTGNYKVYKETKQMWEKYDVIGRTQPGAGGEYLVQPGFGWTNGVILDLLTSYSNRLTAPNNGQDPPTQSSTSQSPISVIPILLASTMLIR